MPVTTTDKIVKLSLPSGSSAEVYLYGATVTSWKVAGKERLFLSQKAALDGSKAIRGGIPVCWPIFGPPPKVDLDESLTAHSKLAQHGFARTSIWKFGETLLDREEGVSIRLHLDPTAEIAKTFPHPFSLSYVVTLAPHQLATDLHVVNPLPSSLPAVAQKVTDAAQSVASALPASIAPSASSIQGETAAAKTASELKFQALLHTYIRVEDASKVKIKGLKKGLTYVDKTKGGILETWEGGDLTIQQETDRVYRDVGTDNLIVEDATGDILKVHHINLKDVVTWNPTEKSGAGIVDMEPNGWNRYVCVEPGHVSDFKTLKPGEKWIGQQVLTVL